MNSLSDVPNGKLILENGLSLEGFSFGARKAMAGEVVFNTSMVGYCESISDPSYAGQILVLTFPMVGNYGVPPFDLDELGLLKYFEGCKVHISGLIVTDYSHSHSHWNAVQSLGEWLTSSGIPALWGIDTRRLTKLLRTSGTILGKIEFSGQTPIAFENPNETHLVSLVSRKSVQKFGQGNQPHILAFDCGMKNNILRCLVLEQKACVTVVPHDYNLEANPAGIKYDGIFVSNGPGDPTRCVETIASLRWALKQTPVIPIFGICLGHQLLALACGASTYKMQYGNRGSNQPCVDLRTTNCFITSQNHGFAVDIKSLPTDWKPLFLNGNDLSNEGIIHVNKPYFSVQFHPEGCGGPQDTAYLFADFVAMINSTPPTRVLVSPSLYDQRTIKKVLLIGSGGLSIGQAGEFDYSGSQAIKALKEERIEVILINPNIATVQTSKHLGRASPDKVYFLPIRASVVEDIIAKERPDGVIVSMGGQTALNVGIELYRAGVFDKYDCRVLGTSIDSIIMTEDRDLFSQKLHSINEHLAKSVSATSIDEAIAAAQVVGYPLLVRAAFALGGLGSGFAENEEELRSLAAKAFAVSSQILLDQDLRGWKEVEYEVVRDDRDNCITVCNMENFDPVGVHTGDSIVVAPSQTLSNSEYYKLRAASIKVIRSLEIVGECNIQYALDPYSEEYCIIEVNARLSRSSALASKATGYPLAYVAAKLSLGKNLVSIRNSITKITTACFEPSLDYCVVKMPRWDLSKFSKACNKLGSAMSSVGEVMAIGKTFEEAMQKAVRMVSGGALDGIDGATLEVEADQLNEMLRVPTDKRLHVVQHALEKGYTVDQISQISKIDRWFLSRLKIIADLKQETSRLGNLESLSTNALRRLKIVGFSDRQIARFTHSTELLVRKKRIQLGVLPFAKQIDTLAAEFPAQTNYLYVTYNASEHDISSSPVGPPSSPLRGQLNKQPSSSLFDRDATPVSTTGSGGVMVLGCGAYCIGSSVEFDWCAVSAIRQLRAMGDRVIVVNYNPETVSTDYDESDVLYFEELTLERVMDIYELEHSGGVIVSVGGQIPNNLALPLHHQGVHILGTCPTNIDVAEDRHKFSAMLDTIKVDQPEWKQLTTREEAQQFALKVGYPVLIRPSFVLSGAAMSVASTPQELLMCLKLAREVSPDKPVVISKYIVNAKEVEFDAVAQNGKILNYAISEHIENAGVHSGDATLVLPAQKLFVQTVRTVKRIASQIAQALNISGPFNIQLLATDNKVRVIECNLRASRTFPFISKTFDVNFITLATKVMMGYANLKPFNISLYDYDYVAVKAPMFSFARLRGADPTLGVEMTSTGEVACFGQDMQEAFLQALLATNFKLPAKSPEKFILVSIAQPKMLLEFQPALEQLLEMGFNICCTPGTAAYYVNQGGIPSHRITVVEKPGQAELRVLNKSSTVDAEDCTSEAGHATTTASNGHGLSNPIALTVSLSGLVPTMLTPADDSPTDLYYTAANTARTASTHSALDWIRSKKIDLLINIPDGSLRRDEITAGYLLRRGAVDFGTSLLTNIKCAVLFCDALHRNRPLPCKSEEEYVGTAPTIGW